MPILLSLPRGGRPLRPALLFCIALSLAATLPARAQREVRHLNVLSPVVGASSAGRYYQLTYGRFVSDKLRFELAGALEQGPGPDGPQDAAHPAYRGYELAVGIAPLLVRVGEAFYLRLPIQIRTRYERRPPTGRADRDGFSVGPSLGVSGELYVHDRLSFTGEFRQGWYPLGSPIKEFPRYVGGGLSIYFGQ